MIKKQLVEPKRIRQINGSFAAVEHRFLQQGFFETLNQYELRLYLFLVLVADRQGLSYYSYDNICKRCGMILEEYISARDGLINKDLIGFDGFFFQILALPEKPISLK